MTNQSSYYNQKVNFINGDIASSHELEHNNITNYDNIIILSYYNINVQEADAKTLICLLHIRNMADKLGKKVNIVSEMFDEKNRELAEVTKADDFIKRLKAKVFTELDDKSHYEEVTEDYIVDEKAHTAILTPHGVAKCG